MDPHSPCLEDDVFDAVGASEGVVPSQDPRTMVGHVDS